MSEKEKTLTASPCLRPEAPHLEVLGGLFLKWNDLRAEVVKAKEARAAVRAELGACKKYVAGDSPCWSEGRVFGNDWCESCEAQDPLHKAYLLAVRKSAAALTTLRREARKGSKPRTPDMENPACP